ncbi:hypothetical protein [Streptosporangium sp. NPDC000396]|uniref:hypothetical protein n=1 Tax=Streptosporangium sp. NPDC000396 TaxID=3366185 RepID=UPI0036AADBDD
MSTLMKRVLAGGVLAGAVLVNSPVPAGAETTLTGPPGQAQAAGEVGVPIRHKPAGLRSKRARSGYVAKPGKIGRALPETGLPADPSTYIRLCEAIGMPQIYCQVVPIPKNANKSTKSVTGSGEANGLQESISSTTP